MSFYRLCKCTNDNHMKLLVMCSLLFHIYHLWRQLKFFIHTSVTHNANEIWSFRNSRNPTFFLFFLKLEPISCFHCIRSRWNTHFSIFLSFSFISNFRITLVMNTSNNFWIYCTSAGSMLNLINSIWKSVYSCFLNMLPVRIFYFKKYLNFNKTGLSFGTFKPFSWSLCESNL